MSKKKNMNMKADNPFVVCAQKLLQNVLLKTGVQGVYLNFNEPESSSWNRPIVRPKELERCASFWICKPGLLWGSKKLAVLNVIENGHGDNITLEIRAIGSTTVKHVIQNRSCIKIHQKEHPLVWSYDLAQRAGEDDLKVNPEKLRLSVDKLRCYLSRHEKADKPQKQKKLHRSHYLPSAN